MQTSREQDKILNGLHWRMTSQRWSVASVDDIVGFWYSLLDYRANVLSTRPWRCFDYATEALPNRLEAKLTSRKVSEALHKWQEDFLWDEATDGQRRKPSGIRQSMFRAVLNNKAAWPYAAIAVLEVGYQFSCFLMRRTLLQSAFVKWRSLPRLWCAG